MKISKLIISISILASLGFIGSALAESMFSDSSFNVSSPKSEIYINKDGKVSIVGAKIVQFAGSTIYARVIWDNAFIRIMLKTNQNAVITRRYGEIIKVANLSIGDYLSVEGNLESNSDSLSVIVATIKDLSDLTQQNNFSGTISSIDSSYSSFYMASKSSGNIKVVLNSSTPITLGSRTVDVYHLKVGDKITSVTGVYDYGTNTLKADKITVYLDMSIFKARNYKGTLKLMSAKTLPAVFVVTIGSKDYTVKLSADTWVINNRRNTISLSRFMEGDSVVFYGALQETDEPIIDNVEIIRNASL